jgi:hypothetical protein
MFGQKFTNTDFVAAKLAQLNTAQLLVARGSRAVAGLSYSSMPESAADFQTQNFRRSFSQNSEPISAASETLSRFVPVQLATVSKQPKLSARGSRTALDSGFEAWAPLFGVFHRLFCSQTHGPCGRDGESAYPYLPAGPASFVRLPFSASLASVSTFHAFFLCSCLFCRVVWLGAWGQLQTGTGKAAEMQCHACWEKRSGRQTTDGRDVCVKLRWVLHIARLGILLSDTKRGRSVRPVGAGNFRGGTISDFDAPEAAKPFALH